MIKRVILSLALLIFVGCNGKKTDENTSVKLYKNLKEVTLEEIEIVENSDPFANKVTKRGEELKVKLRKDDGYYLDYNNKKEQK